jgi:RHS repeat-associated protein
MGWMIEARNTGLTHPLKVNFDYYPDGRRARKIVCRQDGTTWITNTVHQFYYDGWNMTAETITDSTTSPVKRVSRSYTWGLDMAGQRQGRLGQDSGGIDGLLAITEIDGSATNVYYPIGDHHGTILKLVDGQTGTVMADYDYDPFGVLLSKTGAKADLCPFRFTSKYYDPEIGLYYFGYRYYDPTTTKWLTLDPLGEEGGVNLTAYCRNDPANTVDPLGLSDMLIGGEFDLTSGEWTSKTYHEAPDPNGLAAVQMENRIPGHFTIALGANASWSGIIRRLYDLRDAAIRTRAQQMLATGEMTAQGAAQWRVTQRNELIKALRELDTTVGREYANWRKPLKDLITTEQLLAKNKTAFQIIQTRPNYGVDRIGRGLRVLGPTLIVIGLTADVIDVAGTPEEERLRKIVEKTGGYAGATGGAMLGAKGGAYVGSFIPHPAGRPVCAFVGLVGGAFVGGFLAENISLGVYDAFIDE